MGRRQQEARPPVDRRFIKRWQEALSGLRAAQRRGQRAFDERWEIIGDIVDHDPPLYLAAGIASRAAFFREVVGEKPRTAERYIRVARFASPNEELRYGVSKLDAALDYIEERVGTLVKGRVPVSFEKLRIVVTRDGKPRRLRLAEATVAEVRRATAKLRRDEKTASPLAAAVSAALREAGLEVTVRARGGTLALSGIRAGDVARVAKALAEVAAAE